jgi:tRNA pseudouridine38-40 synthase
MRVAIQFAYNGDGFHGYARQPGLKTVEGTLLSSLISEGFIEDVSTARFRSSSRTDKGVSALCNVVAFDTNIKKEDLTSIYHCSTDEIIIYGVGLVKDSFYPRYASLRIYRYYLPKHVIDLETLLYVLSLFKGEHDFSNFARVEQGKNSVRIIENILVGYDDEFLWVDFYAQTFLWHQIRRIMSAILNHGRGKITKNDIIQALEHPTVQVDLGLAPSEPLILKDIRFKDIIFFNLPDQKRKISCIETTVKDRSKYLFS